MDFRDYIRIGLQAEKMKLAKCSNIIKTAPVGRLTLRKNVNGHRRYYITMPGEQKAKYAGKKMMITIYKIKQRKKAELMVEIIKDNIAVREYVLENYRDCSDEAIEAMLPKAYRADEELTEKVFQQTGLAKKVHQSENPYKPEEFAYV